MSGRTIPGLVEARERLRELEEARGGYEPLSGLAASHLAGAARARAAGRPDTEAAELQIACALQELRARRIAMGRDPEDERNAVADLACLGCGDIFGECGCVEAAAEMGAFDEPPSDGMAWDDEGPDDPPPEGWQIRPGGTIYRIPELCSCGEGDCPHHDDPPPVNVEVLRVGPADSEVLALAAEVERLRETLRELTTCDGIGDVEEMLHKREPWLFDKQARELFEEGQNLEGDDPGPLTPGLELVEVAPGVEVARGVEQ